MESPLSATGPSWISQPVGVRRTASPPDTEMLDNPSQPPCSLANTSRSPPTHIRPHAPAVPGKLPLGPGGERYTACASPLATVATMIV